MAQNSSDITYELFPEKPDSYYDWTGILDRKLTYSMQNTYDWSLHIDSDEIRESPTDQSLVQTISFVESLGYNAIDFTVIDFKPTEEKTSGPNSLGDLCFFEFGKRPGHFLQIKGWRQGNYEKTA